MCMMCSDLLFNGFRCFSYRARHQIIVIYVVYMSVAWEYQPPSKVSMERVGQEEDRLSLVMECMEGGELFDRVREKKVYSEKDCQCCLVDRWT